MAQRGTEIDFGAFSALTFDCYGTLIDWESGISAALRSLLPGATSVTDDELLETYGRYESEAEHGEYLPYRSVLAQVARRFLETCPTAGRDPGANQSAMESFAASVADWPAFPDSGAALAELGQTFRLGIVSNVDDDLFAASANRLGTEFDEVVTAQQVGSYKPAPGHFLTMERRLGLPRERILHVAQSLYHDIEPARALGYTCVWVNRRAGRPGAGATPPASATPDLEVPDMASLARRVREAG